ncbi:MAG TPA: PTS sugar transporter subunit IIB, partial [Candidatus Onthosoma merdavium]|nr:PTS sugar transporter subunit IIB [Candidatus Onthosoma merdavium]
KIVDALPLLEAFSFFTSLNIGGLRSRNAKIEISPAIFLNEADLAICKELSRTIEIYFQEIPEHPKIHFQDLQISESRQI